MGVADTSADLFLQTRLSQLQLYAKEAVMQRLAALYHCHIVGWKGAQKLQ